MKLKKLVTGLALAAASGCAFAEPTSLDVNGGRLTIKGEMGAYKLYLNSSLIYSTDATAFGFSEIVEPKYLLPGKDVVLMSESQGASCAMYSFVTISGNPAKAQLTKPFGTCDEMPAVSQKGDSIQLKMKDMKNKTHTFVYRNGNVTGR